jgi:hypothetical protein
MQKGLYLLSAARLEYSPSISSLPPAVKSCFRLPSRVGTPLTVPELTLAYIPTLQKRIAQHSEAIAMDYYFEKHAQGNDLDQWYELYTGAKKWLNEAEGNKFLNQQKMMIEQQIVHTITLEACQTPD